MERTVKPRVTPLAVLGAVLAVLAVVLYQLELKGLGVGLGFVALVMETASWLIDIGGPRRPGDKDDSQDGEGGPTRPKEW
jgi:hypothetical protein